MFVINFDFSTYGFFQKLAAINLPVVLTEIITYPFQRLQNQLIKRQPYYTANQLKQTPLILAQMFKVQGFPNSYHGFRYSLDYSMTQMTFKFFIFDHLMISDWADNNKYALYLSCVMANLVGTVASQSAFNYQAIASSLEPNKNNTTELVKQKLIKFTSNKSALKVGLKYTLPISIINSISQIFLMTNLQGKFTKQQKQSQNQFALPDTGYTRQQLIIASIVLSLTSLTNHFAIQRQLQLCFDMKQRYRYTKGLLGTYVRTLSRGMILYGLYFAYFDYRIKRQVENVYGKRIGYNVVPSYNRTKL